MSDTSTHPTPTPALHLERQDVRQYIAVNSRGAQILIGDGPGCFSPDDLLKIAFAGYDAVSSDERLADQLGEDFRQVAGTSGEYLSNENHFVSLAIELIRDLSKVDEEEYAKLLHRAGDAIEGNCTIAHTLTNPVSYAKTFTDELVDQD